MATEQAHGAASDAVSTAGVNAAAVGASAVSAVTVSIVIVNWNTRALLADCLRAIEGAAAGLRVETIVVDNGSSDGSLEMLRSTFPWVRLIEAGDNLGFARANNLGIRAAQGRYLFLLNSDTVPAAGSITALVAFAEEQPRAGIVAPRLVYPDGSDQPSWAAFPTLGAEMRGVNVRLRRPLPNRAGRPAFTTDWITGAALLCRREMFDDIGLFDEAFFMYSEETDLCLRARRKGWLVCMVDDVTVVHVGGGSASRNNLRQLHLLYENKILYFAKHKGDVQAGLLRGLLVLSTLFGITRRTLQSQLRGDTSAAAQQAIAVRKQLLRDLAGSRVAQTVNLLPSGARAHPAQQLPAQPVSEGNASHG